MLTIIPTAEPYHPRVPPPRPPAAGPPKLIHWPAPRHYLSLPKTYRTIAAKRVKRGAARWHLYGKSGLQTGWLGSWRFTREDYARGHRFRLRSVHDSEQEARRPHFRGSRGMQRPARQPDAWRREFHATRGQDHRFFRSGPDLQGRALQMPRLSGRRAPLHDAYIPRWSRPRFSHHPVAIAHV